MTAAEMNQQYALFRAQREAADARIIQAITTGDVAAADRALTEFLESDVAMQQCAREVQALFGGLGG